MFRCATVSDVDDLVALVESAYRGTSSTLGWTTEAHLIDGQRTDAAAVTEVIGRRGARILMAIDVPAAPGAIGGGPVACCQLERRPGAAAYLGMFAVRPGLQGRGLGRVVIAEAERLVVAEWGSLTMAMSVLAPRSDLIAWYERLGYVRTGDTTPFPYGDERYGLPKVTDLFFVELAKDL